MNIRTIKETLHKFPKQDLNTLKRFLEVVIRQYNFEVLEKNESKTYLNIEVETIKTADLPIIVVRQFVDLLSENIENFFNIHALRKNTYYNFQEYRKLREAEIYDTGKELGYSEKEIKEEIANNFDGIFIRNPDENFIKLVKKVIKTIEGLTKDIISKNTTPSKNDAKKDLYLDDAIGDFNLFGLKGNISIATREYKLLRLLVDKYPTNVTYLEILQIEKAKKEEYSKVDKNDIIFPMIRYLKTVIKDASGNKKSKIIIHNTRLNGYRLEFKTS